MSAQTQTPQESLQPTPWQGIHPTPKDEAVVVHLPSIAEKRTVAQQATRETEEALIETELAKFRAITDAAERKTVLALAEAKWANEVAWSRSLDSKVSPLLAVAGFSIAGAITLLTQAHLFDNAPLARITLALMLLPLLYAVFKSVLVISPTLQVSAPAMRVLKHLHLFGPRHLARTRDQEWQGHLYFGHTAQHKTLREFLAAAIPHYRDESAVLRDTLTQAYNNSHVCYEKCADITMATRGILLALLLALVAGLLFTCGR